MKSAEELRARLGGHMRESMGTRRPEGAGEAPGGAAFHGGTAAKYQGAARIKDALAVEVGRLHPDPDQPRKEFDPGEIADLAASLKARGQLQPIRVRWDEAGARWLIVAGERRYRAALLAGLATLDCVEAKGTPTADDILEDQIVENCLRSDLRPIEQARAFRALIDRRGWSYRQLGEALHVAPASVARALALLDLPADLQEQVTAGVIPASTAYEVSRIDDPDTQRAVAERAVAEGLNRSEVVAAVRRATPAKGKGKGAKGKARPTSASVRTAEGFKVTVEHRRGVDDDAILAALASAASIVRERQGRGEAA